MQMVSRIALALFLVSTAAPPAVAQVQLSRLDGVVVDAADRPVGGVTVTVSDPLGATIRRATADASGRFLIVDLPPGRYRLAVDGGGAVTSPVPLTMADGLSSSVTLRLPPAFRDAVVVEGARPAASIATRTSLGAESIARTPGRTGSRRSSRTSSPRCPAGPPRTTACCTAAASTTASSTSSTACRSTSASIRRRAWRRTPSTVDALTVVTGYVPPEYGYKSGGVIDVRTRAATGTWRGFGEIAAGSDAAADGGGSAGGPIGHGATLWLQASGQRSSRFLDPVHPDNFHNDGGSMRPPGSSRPAAARAIASRRTGPAAAPASTSRTPRSRKTAGQAARQRLGQAAATVSWQRGWSSATVSQVAGYARRGRVQLDPSDADTPLTAEADRRLSRVGALAAVTHQAGRHVVKAGGEVQSLRLEERFGFAVTDEDGAERGRPERRGHRVRPRLAVPLRGPGTARRCSPSTCRTRGRRRRR